MFIARTVLHSTHAELQQRMTPRELRQWSALYSIEPWGEERDDAQADTVCNLLAALHTPKGKSFKARRYTPDYSQAMRPPQTEADMIRTAQNISAMMSASGS
jgi:hypothetical protein